MDGGSDGLCCRVSSTLSRTQERATGHQRNGKSAQYQQNHRLQIQEPFGGIKKNREPLNCPKLCGQYKNTPIQFGESVARNNFCNKLFVLKGNNNTGFLCIQRGIGIIQIIAGRSPI